MTVPTIITASFDPSQHNQGFANHFFMVSSPIETMIFAPEFNHGIVTLDKPLGMTDFEFIKIVIGCFHEDSNFFECVCCSFNNPPKVNFVGIQINIANVNLLVTPKMAKSHQSIYEHLAI